MTRRADVVDRRSRGPALGAARIAVGLLWLANLHWKVPNDFGEQSGGGLYKYSESVTRNSPFAPWTWVTEELILPNFSFFGWFTLVAETALALLLIIGYRTTIAALAGVVMSVPIGLSVLYYDRADEWSWAYILLITAHVMVWASGAGEHVGVDGILRRRDAAAAKRAITTLGVITVVIGAAGLFVSRSVAFAGREVALLGSDAGFVNADGRLVRRWELKFLWFNPLWAMLTIVAGALLLVAVRQRWAARIAGFGLVALAAIVFLTRTFDYLRDDDVVQRISTGSNAAVWGGLGMAALLFERAVRRSTGDAAEPEVLTMSSTS